MTDAHPETPAATAPAHAPEALRAPASDSVHVRCFAALELEQPARLALGGWGDELADVHDGVLRATHRSNLHLTFAFIGDVPETMVPEVALALGAAAAGVPGPVACDVVGASLLGPTRGVLAATVAIDLLTPLAAARDSFVEVARSCGARGVDERPWRPHVTVARARSGETDLTDVLDISRLDVPAASWFSRGISLVASIAAPGGGHHHRVLHAMPFAGRHAAAHVSSNPQG